MTHYTTVINSVKNFLDRDMIAHANGNQRIILRMASAAMSLSPETMFNRIANNQAVQMLGVVDGEDIDIDSLANILIDGLAGDEFEIGFTLMKNDYKFYINADDIRKIKMYCGGSQ